MKLYYKDVLENAKQEINEEKIKTAKKRIKSILKEIEGCEEILIKLREQLAKLLETEISIFEEDEEQEEGED